MGRSSGTDIARDAETGLEIVLRRLGLPPMGLDVHARAIVDATTAKELVGPGRIVVADLITADAREALNAAGTAWWDRRGTLHVTGGSTLVHTNDAALPRTPTAPRRLPSGPLDGVALDLAVTTLLSPTDPPGVRELARALDRSPSSVSAARHRLLDLGLIGHDGRPLDTNLFWAAAQSWAAQPWVRLTVVPAPTASLVAVGPVAAADAGAPLAVGPDTPPRLLTNDRRAHTLLRARHTANDTIDAAATILLVPAAWLVAANPPSKSRHGHPLGHPTLVALDLGGDPARGAEALADWTPEGTPRVW